ncbi:stromal cell-derived factor 2-like [Macrosteles quadrilineatus]|uniref:stromal cell-derived factor 2-like n=1 Tax=Macrosteles quadrilineatus TaxID=74068 RepID=UPI0023E1D12D|nr:stromal cell-derived factor 2-like [Macrosteles quadrilineatus]
MDIPRKVQYVCFVSLFLYTISPDFVHGKAELVTCGSVLKLLNTKYKVRLHSHEVRYATGSEQQSVTGTEDQEDINSHWVVGAKPPCFRGEPVVCKGEIRLTHLTTGMNLRSHYFPSPLAREQEVAAGAEDAGDLWKVLCDGPFWRRDEEVMLKHVSTEVYLAVSGNRFGRPIEGQYEIVGVRGSNSPTRWRVSEGVFIHPPESKMELHKTHTEL